MATITHTCTGCIPIDSAILEVYIALVTTNRDASLAEAARIVSENGRISAESERERLFGIDHAVAVSDHATAEDDHAAAVLDHESAVGDHATAVSDHETAVADHAGIDGVAERAEAAAEAAEHMVDIHQGPPGPSGVSPVIGGNGNWFVWDADTQQFVDTETKAEGVDGVGFESVSSNQDGTLLITLTNGDTITLDLNHNHPQYPKYVYCATQAAYDAITTKESDTLYLILESN